MHPDVRRLVYGLVACEVSFSGSRVKIIFNITPHITLEDRCFDREIRFFSSSSSEFKTERHKKTPLTKSHHN